MTRLLKLDVNFDLGSWKLNCLIDISIAILSNIIAPKPRNYGGSILYLKFRNSALVEEKSSLRYKI